MLFHDQSMHDYFSSESPTLSDDRSGSVSSVSKKPIPRKGHTKSRRGCLHCKRRRIKCNELHPGEHICESERVSQYQRYSRMQTLRESRTTVRISGERHSSNSTALCLSAPARSGRFTVNAWYLCMYLYNRRNQMYLTIKVDDGHAIVPPLHRHRVSALTRGRR
jgi:hypothetical protein